MCFYYFFIVHVQIAHFHARKGEREKKGRERERRDSHIDLCSNQANTVGVFPKGTSLLTNLSQFALTDPVGPHSSMLMMTRPTSHSTKNMKAPIITMDGRRRRCAISHSNITMKPTVKTETVM